MSLDFLLPVIGAIGDRANSKFFVDGNSSTILHAKNTTLSFAHGIIERCVKDEQYHEGCYRIAMEKGNLAMAEFEKSCIDRARRFQVVASSAIELIARTELCIQTLKMQASAAVFMQSNASALTENSSFSQLASQLRASILNMQISVGAIRDNTAALSMSFGPASTTWSLPAPPPRQRIDAPAKPLTIERVPSDDDEPLAVERVPSDDDREDAKNEQ